MPWGMLWMEQHFKYFLPGQRPWKGVWLRLVWQVGCLFYVMAFAAVLKVNLFVTEYEAQPANLWEMSQHDWPIVGPIIWSKIYELAGTQTEYLIHLKIKAQLEVDPTNDGYMCVDCRLKCAYA